MDMTQELVYNLVASNPQLRGIVEQTAKLYQMQQQAQQMSPVLQQMAQNPLGAVNNYVNWQQQQQAPAPQPAQTQAQPQAAQQGGQPVGMMEQAMEIVGKFEKSLEVLNGNLKEVYTLCQANAEAIKALTDKLDDGKGAAKGKVSALIGG